MGEAALITEKDLKVLRHGIMEKLHISTVEGFTPALCKQTLGRIGQTWMTIATSQPSIYQMALHYSRDEAELLYAIKVIGLVNKGSSTEETPQQLFSKYIKQVVTVGCVIFSPPVVQRFMEMDVRAYCQGLLPALEYFHMPRADHHYHGMVVTSALANVVGQIALSQCPSRPIAKAIEILSEFSIQEEALQRIIVSLCESLPLKAPISN